MAIEQDEIEKIAELARIRIADEQIGQVTQRITEILRMVDQLQAVDTRTWSPWPTRWTPPSACARTR